MDLETALQALESYVASKHGGSKKAAARELGVGYDMFWKWLHRLRTPNSEDFSAVMEKIGVAWMETGKADEGITQNHEKNLIRELTERLADKNEIIALQREKIAEQKEKIAELEREIPVYADIREKLEALRKNQEMFARVHMLAKLATKEGQNLADEIGLNQESFVKNMDDDEKMAFWRSLGERLVHLANFPHIPSEVAINLEKYLIAFREKKIEHPKCLAGASSTSLNNK